MRETKLDDLVSVSDFMYDAEANVFQHNIESCLALGNELKLKGLTDLPNKTSEDIPEVRQKGDKIQKSYLQIGVGETNPPDKYKSEEFINENDLISISDVHERTVAVSDDYQFSNIIKLAQKQYFGTGNMCLLCDKVFFNTGNQIKHIKDNHQNQKVVCRICGRTFNDIIKMNEHIGSKHSVERKVFNCHLCNQGFNQQYNFTKHIQKSHLEHF